SFFCVGRHRELLSFPTRRSSDLWIDGFKVADPLIAAYGRGLLPEFPALADTILDVIPVDYVVNAILAAAAAAPPAHEASYYQVSDRKSTRLNSSHVSISYAVFCL